MPPARSLLSKLGRGRRAQGITSNGSLRTSITPSCCHEKPKQAKRRVPIPSLRDRNLEGADRPQKGGRLPSGMAHSSEGSKETELERSSPKAEQSDSPMLA